MIDFFNDAFLEAHGRTYQIHLLRQPGIEGAEETRSLPLPMSAGEILRWFSGMRNVIVYANASIPGTCSIVIGTA